MLVFETLHTFFISRSPITLPTDNKGLRLDSHFWSVNHKPVFNNWQKFKSFHEEGQLYN